MADADEILDAAATAATGPKSVTVDGQTVTQFSPAEQREAAKTEAMRGKTVKQLFANSTRLIAGNPRA